jgi:hypothetical protein
VQLTTPISTAPLWFIKSTIKQPHIKRCQRTNKGQTPIKSHNLFIQTLVGQINDTTSLAETMVNLESHKGQEALDVEYSSFFKNNT